MLKAIARCSAMSAHLLFIVISPDLKPTSIPPISKVFSLHIFLLKAKIVYFNNWCL